MLTSVNTYILVMVLSSTFFRLSSYDIQSGTKVPRKSNRTPRHWQMSSWDLNLRSPSLRHMWRSEGSPRGMSSRLCCFMYISFILLWSALWFLFCEKCHINKLIWFELAGLKNYSKSTANELYLRVMSLGKDLIQDSTDASGLAFQLIYWLPKAHQISVEGWLSKPGIMNAE